MMFRQEGDMGRYVAFNDPGQPGAGFSSLEEYLAAGNQMPQLPNREPLQQANPISGAQQATPGNPFGQFAQVTPPSVPVSEQTPMLGLPEAPKAIRSPGLPSLDLDPEGLQEALRTVDPIVSGDNSIASTQQVPFDRIGQQMINFEDMFGPLNTRLNKIEEGIASLLDNRGQGLNMNNMPTRNLNNFFQEPIGTFPFRSFYG
tara:strand:- start:15 stop:620 length:606 start_codon:yes stop_codon:yes gene_type:complete